MLKVLDFIRGIQRPLLTIGSGGVILFMMLTGKSVPGELWVFFSTVSGFTVAERAIKHATENGRPPGP